jgi:hypothetical protein
MVVVQLRVEDSTVILAFLRLAGASNCDQLIHRILAPARALLRARELLLGLLCPRS